MDQAQEGIREIEDRSFKIIQAENNNKNNNEKE